MFMLKSAILVGLALPVTGAFAQSANQQEARSVAALPDVLPDTGELAPPKPPASSKKDVSEVQPDSGSYGVGQTVDEEEIASIDIDVMPGGATHLHGSGSHTEGAEIYSTACAACHGEALEGNKELGAPALVGGRDTLASDSPVKTVESYWPYAATLVDYIHRAMPMNAPGSLSADEAYAVSAYVLGEAGIIDKDFTLSSDTLEQVKMPNADGFVDDPRPDVN